MKNIYKTGAIISEFVQEGLSGVEVLLQVFGGGLRLLVVPHRQECVYHQLNQNKSVRFRIFDLKCDSPEQDPVWKKCGWFMDSHCFIIARTGIIRIRPSRNTRIRIELKKKEQVQRARIPAFNSSSHVNNWFRIWKPYIRLDWKACDKPDMLSSLVRACSLNCSPLTKLRISTYF